MQGGGKDTSQQGRVVTRGTAKATRNPEEKRKRVGECGRSGQEVKTGGVGDVSNRGSDPETRRKPLVPPVNRTKPKVIKYSKADENRVSDSIQKLLSVYQGAKADKSADGPRPNVDAKKTGICAGRSNASKLPEIQGGFKNGPFNMDKYRRRISPVQRKTSDAKDLAVRREEAHARKTTTVQKPKLRQGVSKTELPAEDVKAPEKGTKQCDEIIPLLTPDRTNHSPLTQIRSFIANYLEEPSEDRSDKNKLELFVPETSANEFPVCSKRATDHIPSSDAVQPDMSPGTRELIIMLRRRNSEPYSPKSCILKYSDDHPLSPTVSDAWGFENYYFWEQGPIHPSKPYWEVSLFKSSSALESGAGALPSPTPARDPGRIVVNGDFGLRTAPKGRAVKSCDPDLHSCRSVVRTVPFASSVESVIRHPCEPAPVETPGNRPCRGISKDDQYKHPAHLLVYVKSSQKKFVSLDSSRDRAGGLANRKVHKIRKIVGGVSDARGTSPSKNILFVVASAVVLLTGGLAFFAYLLARGPALFSLTPPVPGLLRRC